MCRFVLSRIEPREERRAVTMFFMEHRKDNTMDTEPVKVEVEVPTPEPETPPVADTPPVVVVNTDSEPGTPTDGVVGAVIDHAAELAELRAQNEQLAQELEALRARQEVTAVVAEVAADEAAVAARAAEEAAAPPADAESDSEPDRRSGFHKFWFGGNPA